MEQRSDLYDAWRRVGWLLMVALSPIGGGFVAMLFVVLGLCDAMGMSGTNCSLGVFNGYFEGLLYYVELGVWRFYSYLWVPLGGFITFKLCIALSKAVVNTHNAR